MPEGRYRTFAPLDELPADWPNALASFTAPLSNLNLAPKNLNVVMAPVSSQQQLSLGVDGLWRYTEVELDAAVPVGAAQTYDIVATTTANSFHAPTKEGEGEGDLTNYSFALQVVKTGTVPSGGGIAAVQKVGEVDWDGAKIVGLRQQVGTLRSTDPLTPTQPIASMSALTVVGIAGASAAVAKLSSPEAGGVLLELLQGAAAKVKVLANGNIQWVGGPTLEHAGTELIVAGKFGVTEAVTLSAGGTSTTPAADDNSTKIATTAYVLGQHGIVNPQMDGVAAVGISTRWARQDHVHPIDTSRAPVVSPTFTGNPVDLTNVTGVAGGAGAQVGDKIALNASSTGYGIGMAASRMVLYAPNGSGVGVRAATSEGSKSNGVGSADAIFLNTAGQILVYGAINPFAARKSVGDANPYFDVTSAGVLQWGAGGAAAQDVSLERSGAGAMTLGGDFAVSGVLSAVSPAFTGTVKTVGLSVTGALALPASSIVSSAINGLAVTTSKLSEGAVTSNKVAANAITGDKLGINSQAYFRQIGVPEGVAQAPSATRAALVIVQASGEEYGFRAICQGNEIGNLLKRGSAGGSDQTLTFICPAGETWHWNTTLAGFPPSSVTSYTILF